MTVVESPEVAAPPPRRSRTVRWVSLGVLVFAGLFVAVLAFSKPAHQANGSSPLIGKPAPSLSGPTIGDPGSPSPSGDSGPGSATGGVSLAQFRGKWVLVNFAASWCVPCRQETPELIRFQSEHAATGDATVLAVPFDPADRANLYTFLQKQGADWPTVDDANAEITYGVKGIPESYLVDPRGRVVAVYFGGVKAAQIDRVIGQATRASS